MHYRYAQKWVNLFDKEEHMKQIESAQYIKGLHNLITSLFDLRNVDKFKETIAHLENFAEEGKYIRGEGEVEMGELTLYKHLCQ